MYGRSSGLTPLPEAGNTGQLLFFWFSACLFRVETCGVKKDPWSGGAAIAPAQGI
jgi:hypothetical protein